MVTQKQIKKWLLEDKNITSDIIENRFRISDITDVEFRKITNFISKIMLDYIIEHKLESCKNDQDNLNTINNTMCKLFSNFIDRYYSYTPPNYKKELRNSFERYLRDHNDSIYDILMILIGNT